MTQQVNQQSNQQSEIFALGLMFKGMLDVVNKTLGTAGNMLEYFAGTNPATGLITAVAATQAQAPAATSAQLQTVALTSGDKVEAQILSDKTQGGRGRKYIEHNGKRIVVALEGGFWRERKKPSATFENYQLKDADKPVLAALATPKTYKDLGAALGMGDSKQLLGRYRTLQAAGLIKRDENGLISLVKPVAEPAAVEPAAKKARVRPSRAKTAPAKAPAKKAPVKTPAKAKAAPKPRVRPSRAKAKAPAEKAPEVPAEDSANAA